MKKRLLIVIAEHDFGHCLFMHGVCEHEYLRAQFAQVLKIAGFTMVANGDDWINEYNDSHSYYYQSIPVINWLS